jgi:class 3 adenylate cyclase
MERSQTRYAQSGRVSIAYQVAGDGVPLVWVPGFISHAEMNWEIPPFAHALERMVRFARFAVFDKRGIGLSDRSVDFGSIEERMDDIRAVMDAVGFERASIFAISEGGPLSILFAATYPERVDKLVLYGSFARLSWAPDHPIGVPDGVTAEWLAMLERTWGTGQVLRTLAQYAPDPITEQALLSRLERYTATPPMAAAIMRHNLQLDVRQVLPSVHTPAMVIHTVGDPVVPVAVARDLAQRLANCQRYIELDEAFHVSWRGDHHDLVVDPIEEFLTGEIISREEPGERVLTTVLFADIVDSTTHARELGDARWRSLLDAHDRAASEEIGRARGRMVKHTGDGVLACFDGPARAVRCAQRLASRARSLGLEIRAGVHTGECEVRGDDLAGITVHVAARVMALAGGGEVLATRTVRDLVDGSGLKFEDRGAQALKGITDTVQVFAAPS